MIFLPGNKPGAENTKEKLYLTFSFFPFCQSSILEEVEMIVILFFP